MKFYPGLTPPIIMDLTWSEFMSYLGEIPKLLRIFNGLDPASDGEVVNMFKKRGII